MYPPLLRFPLRNIFIKRQTDKVSHRVDAQRVFVLATADRSNFEEILF